MARRMVNQGTPEISLDLVVFCARAGVLAVALLGCMAGDMEIATPEVLERPW